MLNMWVFVTIESIILIIVAVICLIKKVDNQKTIYYLGSILSLYLFINVVLFSGVKDELTGDIVSISSQYDDDRLAYKESYLYRPSSPLSPI